MIVFIILAFQMVNSIHSYTLFEVLWLFGQQVVAFLLTKYSENSGFQIALNVNHTSITLSE